MRASTCDTVSRLCVRPVCCWFAFPLVPALAAPQRIAPPCSPSSLLLLGPTSRARSSSASVIPSRCGPGAGLLWPNAGSPKFQRDPFARDLLYDAGRTGMASLSGLVRVAFDHPHGLRSCDDPVRGSITHPTQLLCTLRGRRCRRLMQHSLPGRLLGITWVGLSPTDRASFAWRLRRIGPVADPLTTRQPSSGWELMR